MSLGELCDEQLFLLSAEEVFSVMLGVTLERRSEVPTFPVRAGGATGPMPHGGKVPISGIVGLTGRRQGVFVITMTLDTARAAYQRLLGPTDDPTFEEIRDSVGELANMVAGAAKSRLPGETLGLSLPSVVCGPRHLIEFPSWIDPLAKGFRSDLGDLRIMAGLTERPNRASRSAYPRPATF